MANTPPQNDKSEKVDPSSDAEHLFVYATAKAGMNEVDKAKIQQTIYEASKGSAYFQNEQRKAAQVEERMKGVKNQLKHISNTQIEQMQHQCNKYIQQMDLERDVSRTWIHCDMDMFYAAVAMRDNPTLKGKPIAIGSMSMISTTNYIARKYGVRAAMPGFIGKKLCPQLLFVKHDWNAYKQASNKVREIVAEYDPNFTAASLDEVYLDITDYLEQHEPQISGSDVAKEIRDKIVNATQLTASAGVACNRMLCKIGSDMNKPNGQFILESDGEIIKQFMRTLNVRKIPGIGKVTQRILKEIGVKTGAQCLEKAAYVKLFFKQSTYEWLLASCFGVARNKRDANEIHQRKSISQERTFSWKGVSDAKVLEEKIVEICDGLYDDIMEKKIRGKTVTVKLKTTEFETKTRAKNIGFYTNDKKVITNCALQILRKEYPIKIRLLGVRLSGLEQKMPQSKLQKQITNFWTVKKEGNEQERKVCNVRKRKRNWKEMMDESGEGKEDRNTNNKRRKVTVDVGMESEGKKNNNKWTISQMFEAQDKKNRVRKQEKYLCPICYQFECKSNLELNLHLDQCLQGTQTKKKTKHKKANKNTLTQFFTVTK
eukprot:381396_1